MNPADAIDRSLIPKSSSLDVFLLGAVELRSTLELLDRLRMDIASRSDHHGAMLVCEHPPSISIGREGSFADVLVDREELIARRMEVRWTNRGGATIVHFPGQLCAYVVVPLDRINCGVLEFRSRLENSLISTAKDFQIDANRSTTPSGVTGRLGQFAFTGTSVRDWISASGVYLNVSMPQEALELIRWGPTEPRITTLSTLRTRAIAMSSVRESLTRNLATSLGYESYHIFTGHPLLHRTTRTVYEFA